MEYARYDFTSIIGNLLTKTEILATSDASMLNQQDISQPACTAIQIGLVDLLSEWSIHPARLAGHSSGEIGKTTIGIVAG